MKLQQLTYAILSLGLITATDLNKLLYAWELLRTDEVMPITPEKTAELMGRFWSQWLIPTEFLKRLRDGEDVMLEMYVAFIKKFKEDVVLERFIQEVQYLQRHYPPHFGTMMSAYKQGDIPLDLRDSYQDLLSSSEFKRLEQFYDGFMAMIGWNEQIKFQIQAIADKLRDNPSLVIWVPSHTNLYHCDENIRNFAKLGVSDYFSEKSLVGAATYDPESRVQFLFSPWIKKHDHDKILQEVIFSNRMLKGARIISLIDTVKENTKVDYKGDVVPMSEACSNEGCQFLSFTVEPGARINSFLDSLSSDKQLVVHHENKPIGEAFHELGCQYNYYSMEPKCRHFLSLPLLELSPLAEDVRHVYFINLDDIITPDLHNASKAFAAKTGVSIDLIDKVLQEEHDAIMHQFKLGMIGPDDFIKQATKALNAKTNANLRAEDFELIWNEINPALSTFIDQLDFLKNAQDQHASIKLILLSYTSPEAIAHLINEFNAAGLSERLTTWPSFPNALAQIDEMPLFTTCFHRQPKEQLLESLIWLLDPPKVLKSAQKEVDFHRFPLFRKFYLPEKYEFFYVSNEALAVDLTRSQSQKNTHDAMLKKLAEYSVNCLPHDAFSSHLMQKIGPILHKKLT